MAKIGNSVDIAISGLRAQAMRMNVISNNIANANTAKTEKNDAFHRKFVVLSTNSGDIAGVTIDEIAQDDKAEMPKIWDPGRPEADGDGYVTMPNVSIPMEMMNLVMASRAYEASASVLKSFQQNLDATLELLR